MGYLLGKALQILGVSHSSTRIFTLHRTSPLSASVLSTHPGLEGISLPDDNFEQDSSDPGDILAYCVGKNGFSFWGERRKMPQPPISFLSNSAKFNWNVFPFCSASSTYSLAVLSTLSGQTKVWKHSAILSVRCVVIWAAYLPRTQQRHSPSISLFFQLVHIEKLLEKIGGLKVVYRILSSGIK